MYLQVHDGGSREGYYGERRQEGAAVRSPHVSTGGAAGERGMREHETDIAGEGAIYALRVRGHLAPRWSAWFDGLAITREADGTTTLTGPVADQPALYGVISRLRDLGLTLLSVQRIGP